jgi:hypothetical protein
MSQHWLQPVPHEAFTFAKQMLVRALNRSSGRAEDIDFETTVPIEIVGQPTERLFEQFLRNQSGLSAKAPAKVRSLSSDCHRHQARQANVLQECFSVSEPR